MHRKTSQAIFNTLTPCRSTREVGKLGRADNIHNRIAAALVDKFDYTGSGSGDHDFYLPLNISAFPPVVRDWVTKGLGMSSLVYATGHIKDPMPLIAKRRGLSPGGRFPPSFIHQVIIITGLNKLYNCMFSP